MKSEFEKWYRDKHQITKPLYFFEDTQRYEDGFTQDAWEVWQHQQSKVDELQKRVDAALKMISINRGFAWGSVSISQLGQTLKGGS